jgi:hypothetical protein
LTIYSEDEWRYLEGEWLVTVTESILNSMEPEIRQLADETRAETSGPSVVLLVIDDLEAMTHYCCGGDEVVAGSYMDYFRTLHQLPVARFSMLIPDAWRYVVGKWGATDGKRADWQRFVADLEAHPDHILAGAWYAGAVGGKPTVAQTLRLLPPTA